jgi:hypothetical protein
MGACGDEATPYPRFAEGQRGSLCLSTNFCDFQIRLATTSVLVYQPIAAADTNSVWLAGRMIATRKDVMTLQRH